MRWTRVLVPLMLVLHSADARAVGSGALPDSIVYQLYATASEFEWGCFDPCECPILVRSPMAGTFLLRKVRVGPLYTYYDVLDVDWKFPESTGPGTIRGDGIYRRGGEVARQEQMVLDLSFDGGPLQRFDSGLNATTAGLPEIALRLSLHGEYCRDSLLVVNTRPIGLVDVSGDPVAGALRISPNPFLQSARIALDLPSAGEVSLAVFDLAGRRVHKIADHEWLEAGAHDWAWGGRLDGGGEAPPGLYFVRADGVDGRNTRTVVRVR